MICHNLIVLCAWSELANFSRALNVAHNVYFSRFCVGLWGEGGVYDVMKGFLVCVLSLSWKQGWFWYSKRNTGCLDCSRDLCDNNNWIKHTLSLWSVNYHHVSQVAVDLKNWIALILSSDYINFLTENSIYLAIKYTHTRLTKCIPIYLS